LVESRAAESGRPEAVTDLAIEIGSCSGGVAFDDRGDPVDELSDAHSRLGSG
jgi:hypothetical protein